jgi:signal peptidase II
MTEELEFSAKRVFQPLHIGIFVGVLVLDQLTKVLIMWKLPLGSKIPLLPFFEITHIKNRGAAFGIFHDSSDTFRAIFFGIVTIICIYLLVQWLGKTPLKEKLIRVCLAMVLGGAFGNLIDRVAFGEVTDFVHVFWRGVYSYPAFNIADSAISVGIALILLHVFVLSKRKKKAV